MADIPVQPKRAGTPWWLWLVALVILAAIVWLAVTYFSDDEGGDTDRIGVVDAGTGVPPDAAPVPLALSLAAPLTPIPR